MRIEDLLRRRAERLEHLAEHVAERETCRDVAGERNMLREQAGHADQRATVAERTAAGRVITPRRT
jgi:hypothetical protein